MSKRNPIDKEFAKKSRRMTIEEAIEEFGTNFVARKSPIASTEYVATSLAYQFVPDRDGIMKESLYGVRVNRVDLRNRRVMTSGKLKYNQTFEIMYKKNEKIED